MQSGRLFRLLYLLLEGENWTVRRLSERLEASERTIRRDLDALSAAGIPVYTVQGRGDCLESTRDCIIYIKNDL